MPLITAAKAGREFLNAETPTKGSGRDYLRASDDGRFRQTDDRVSPRSAGQIAMLGLAEDVIELEWIKDEKDGSYRHDQFRIVPFGGKFALEIVEGKGKKSRATQACKGPLKVCKGFALDISEGKLVKLESGNWGTLPVLEVKPLPLVQPSPLTPPVAPVQPDPLPAVEPLPAPPSLSVFQACAILSREMPISSLPPGSHFVTSTGIFGRFVEMIGMDAKVELEKGGQSWSNASPVYWLPCKIKGEVKPGQPISTPIVRTRSEAPAKVKTKAFKGPLPTPNSPEAESIF